MPAAVVRIITRLPSGTTTAQRHSSSTFARHSAAVRSDEATKQFAKLAKEYRVRAWSATTLPKNGWPPPGAAATFATSQRAAQVAIYLECLPLFTRGLVALPDHKRLLRELRLLERHTHRSGRDTVDHGKNGSDDYINCHCGVLRDLATISATASSAYPRIFADAVKTRTAKPRARRATKQYRNEFAARIFAISGGQCWPR